MLCQRQVVWTEWSQTMFFCFVFILNQLMPPSPSCSVYLYTWFSNFICILRFQMGIVKVNGSVGDFCPVKVHKQLLDVLRIFRLLVLEVVFSIIIFISPKKVLKMLHLDVSVGPWTFESWKSEYSCVRGEKWCLVLLCEINVVVSK